MATSTLLEPIRVNNPKLIEEFVAAMEASENAPLDTITDADRSEFVTDPERIRNFMAKALKKRETAK